MVQPTGFLQQEALRVTHMKESSSVYSGGCCGQVLGVSCHGVLWNMLVRAHVICCHRNTVAF